MKILPESQIYNLPILEAVLEELRLNIIDHLQYLADAKYLYSLDSLEIKQKLGLLGLSSINIGKFISLNLESDEFEYISPEFYKMYRKLNQHRGNKMSMDYIFHSAGMMNTLVHSNDKYYNATNIFQDVGSFFDFNTYRDNQFPELGVGDGYIIVPYSSNNTQLLKQYLASNPIIFNFLPAGYTFIFFSEYRNSYNTGVLQYDNLLNYLDLITTTIDGTDIVYYVQPIYWEPYDEYDVDEQLIYPGSDEDSTYTRKLYYYDPFYFRDGGFPALIDEYSRFADDSLYTLPFKDDTYTFTTLEEYLAYYAMLLSDSVLTDYEHGLESDLNNQLFFKDVWVGDYLLSYLIGENIEDEYPDHVKGLKAIHSPSYTYASLYERGQSIASQYLQREQGIISKTDTLIQEHKPEIISDRRELDLIKIIFNDVYSLWMLLSNSVNEASELIQNILGLDSDIADYLAANVPSLLKDDLDYTTAEDIFNQFVNSLPYHGVSMQVCVKDSVGNIVLINEINSVVYNTVANNYIAGRASVIYRNSMTEKIIVPEYSYLLINESTGEEVLSHTGQEFVTTEMSSSFVTNKDFVVTPLSDYELLTAFYLSPEGNAEITDHILTASNPLYDAVGTRILVADFSVLDDASPLYFMNVGNQFFDATSEDKFVDGGSGNASLEVLGSSLGKQALRVYFPKPMPEGLLYLWVKVTDNSEMISQQTRVIKTSTINTSYLYEVYEDEALTQRFTMSSSKTYESGSIRGNVWTPSAVQSVSDMPSSTTSTSSSATRAVLLVDNSGTYIWFATNLNVSSSSISAPGNKYQVIFRAYNAPYIDIDVTFGTPVTIPEGYVVDEVKCSWGFAFGTGDSLSSTQGTLSYDGQDIYSTDVNASEVGVQVKPCIFIMQGSGWSGTELTGYRVSTSPAVYNSSYSCSSISDVSVNSSGKFVALTFEATSSIKDSIINGITNGYPCVFSYRNSNDALVPYFFDLPTTLWRFSNGTFSWLGDPTDNTGLTYYYKNNSGGAPVRIHCVPYTPPEPPAPLLTAYYGSVPTAINLTSGSSILLWLNGSPISYDTTKTYVAVRIYSSSSDTTGIDASTGFSFFKDSYDRLTLKNKSGVTVTFYKLEYRAL